MRKLEQSMFLLYVLFISLKFTSFEGTGNHNTFLLHVHQKLKIVQDNKAEAFAALSKGQVYESQVPQKPS